MVGGLRRGVEGEGLRVKTNGLPPGPRQGTGAWETLVGMFRQRMPNDGFGQEGQIGPALAGGRDGAGHMGDEKIGHARAFKRRSPGDHFIQHHAQRVHIAGRQGLVAAGLFG